MNISDEEIIALVQKLGGHVELTDQDIAAAEGMELQRCDPDGFTRGTQYRVRPVER